jgi:hemerythrin
VAFQWDETLSTGVPKLDEQHKDLIRHLNELIEATRSGHGSSELGKLFDYLAHYATEHFRDEECCMARFMCPTAEINRRMHQTFLLNVASCRKRMDTEGPTSELALEMEHQLAHWILSHMKDVDGRMKQYAMPNAA